MTVQEQQYHAWRNGLDAADKALYPFTQSRTVWNAAWSAAQQDESAKLQEATRKLLEYWRRNSPTNLQYDKLGDYVKLLRDAFTAQESP
jgi:hypothetical protein